MPIGKALHQYKQGKHRYVFTLFVVAERRLTQTPPMSKRRALGDFSGAIVDCENAVLRFLNPRID